MWFAIISMMGMSMLGPFQDMHDCKAALMHEVTNRVAYRGDKGDFKPEVKGFCYNPEIWVDAGQELVR